MGIGGSGASAVAAIAQSQGYQVTGCDKSPFNEFTKVFKKTQLFEGHSKDHLQNVDILAITPAILSLDPHNPELTEAYNKGIELINWQEFMGKYLEKDKFVIAVCGTHGKSTTTAMIGTLLEDANLDPVVELGAIIPKWKTNYRTGKGKYFVTEADEFNDNFLASIPDIAVVTAIEMDHPEYFKNFDAYKKSFAKFLSKTKKIVIANLSDPGVNATLASHLPAGRHGLTSGNAVIDYSKQLIDFPLQIPGKFNILNSSAAYQVGLALKINPQVIKQSLSNFSGIGRRFEFLGEYNKAKIYSDFAHHPTEIRVTLETAREKFSDQKIIVVFQPHMFSRTYALFNDFVKIFQELPVDKSYILDIFPSREVDTGLVSSKQLVEAVNKSSVIYIPSKEEVLEELKKKVREGDVIFFMGAGATDELAKKFIHIMNF